MEAHQTLHKISFPMLLASLFKGSITFTIWKFNCTTILMVYFLKSYDLILWDDDKYIPFTNALRI